MGSLIPSSRSAKARFAQMVERTQAQLYAFVRGFIGDSEEARDVVQDTYVSAWKAAYRGTAPFVPESDDNEARKWLFHAAYCRAVSNLRHRGVIAWESLDASLPPQPAGPSESPFENRIVDAEVVRAALAELESADAACLMLSVVQGFTSVEIAQIFGITPEAARKRLSRAMQRLRAAYFLHDGAAVTTPMPVPAQSERSATTNEEEMCR
ncbi:MAG TPA: sigma-70 family RNA polymerase sigma factor [Ktedonobacterales bacterium]